ncbi:MAG: MFS transporter, partial [Deltaproteobacteria bacterium]|nr:MFS transporter [Deltaproteobacteria bacterium]
MAKFLIAMRHFRGNPSDLRRVFLAYLVSNLGNFSARLTLAVIIYDLTGNTASLAASFIVVKLPMVIFGNALGRMGSFLNQRRVLMVADSVSIVLFTCLAFSYKWIGPFWTAACFFVSYVIASLFDSAKAHYIARISPTKEELNYAVATIAEIIYIAVALGPFIGGYLIEWLNVSAVLLFNSATFAISILYVRRLADVPARMKFWRALLSAFRVTDGWGIGHNFRIVRSHALLSRFTVFFACRSITYGLINAITPVIALAKLGLGSAGLG